MQREGKRRQNQPPSPLTQIAEQAAPLKSGESSYGFTINAIPIVADRFADLALDRGTIHNT